MVQDVIEAMLRKTLGLDVHSIGTHTLERAIAKRQEACQIGDRSSYAVFLRSSPDELQQLIEAIVVPETWFFRDRQAFESLKQFVKDWRSHTSEIFRVLSIPCSTGEEPYSIAITLLEVGLKTHEFSIDAVDVSERALAHAKQGIYRERSFRNQEIQRTDNPRFQQYFQKAEDGFEVCPIVRRSIYFAQGNILDPKLLVNTTYPAIFCRNLLIYLDKASREQVICTLDRVLVTGGILFLGAVETPQLAGKPYTAVDHAFSFAYRKQLPQEARVRRSPSAATRSQRRWVQPSPPSTSAPVSTVPTRQPLAHAPPVSPLAPLVHIQELANGGHLAQAAQLCESYLRANPTAAQAHLLLGEIYQGLNHPKQAEQHFQKAIYLNPEAYEALIHLALLKEQQGDHNAAERLRKRVQRLVNS